MIDKEKFAELAKKYLEGKATPAERDFLEDYYNKLDSGKPIETVFSELQARELKKEMFDHIQSEINKPSIRYLNTRQKVLRYTAVAASILLVCLTGVLLYHRSIAPMIAGADLTTSYAESGMKKLQLSDGTLVWLNAKSRLRYPSDFTGKTQREIYLEGEAYFEVHSDKAHPFLVHTQGLTTRVLGTSFDVKAYNPQAIQVTLVEGKVMLTANRANSSKTDTLFLTPNERALYTVDKLQNYPPARTNTPESAKQRSALTDKVNTTAILSKHAVINIADYTSWRNGELVFNQERLETVLETLNRQLDVSIKAAPELMDCPVTLKVTSESIDHILFEITRQVKRKKVIGHQQYEAGTQYKKTGAEYYIE